MKIIAWDKPNKRFYDVTGIDVVNNAVILLDSEYRKEWVESMDGNQCYERNEMFYKHFQRNLSDVFLISDDLKIYTSKNELPDETNTQVSPTNKQCRNCEHIQAWQCNSKVFQYCGIRKSNRTSNGLLKIKCKNPACNLFKQKKERSNDK